jgi:hypothetical protein
MTYNSAVGSVECSSSSATVFTCASTNLLYVALFRTASAHRYVTSVACASSALFASYRRLQRLQVLVASLWAQCIMSMQSFLLPPSLSPTLVEAHSAVSRRVCNRLQANASIVFELNAFLRNRPHEPAPSRSSHF